MTKIAVVTDSNSGITQEYAKEIGVFVLPMPFYIDEKLYLEGITLSQEEFYRRLGEDAQITTSQPSPGEVTDLWNDILKEYDEIVHIPMSSGLSASCQTATMLAQDYENKVHVVNNQRISVTQRQSVMDAIALAKAGFAGADIKNRLEEEKLEASIYLTLDTLKYLKKGGRITPAAAAIGEVLNLKPVLQIQGEKLDAYAKCRGRKAAKKIMVKAMNEDIQKRFAVAVNKKQLALYGAYAGNYDEAQVWKQEIEKLFPGYEVIMDALSLSVACHVGPGVLAIACAKKVNVD